MDKIIFGKTGLLVSRIAFGGIPIMRLTKEDAVRVVRKSIELGINFIDTATGYSDSEEKIGEAIKGIKREKLVIASKSPASDKKTFMEHIDLSLKRLGVDYIDIYQLHNVGSIDKYNAVFDENGAMAALERAVKEGKVKYPGFSSHTMKVAKKLIESKKFYSVQVPFNFVDSEVLDEVIPLAKKLNMGIIAMKPLGGGLLTNAELCFKYLLQFDGIIPDPGIEKIEEVEEITSIVNNNKSLTEADKNEIERIRKETGKIWCHRCDYCQPCPKEIKISAVLVAKSFTKRMPIERVKNMIGKEISNAGECIECRECVKRCPYSLDIPVLLKETIKFWDEYISTN